MVTNRTLKKRKYNTREGVGGCQTLLWSNYRDVRSHVSLVSESMELLRIEANRMLSNTIKNNECEATD